MRNTWSNEEKVAIIKEVKTAAVFDTCRKHGVYSFK